MQQRWHANELHQLACTSASGCQFASSATCRHGFRLTFRQCFTGEDLHHRDENPTRQLLRYGADADAARLYQYTNWRLHAAHLPAVAKTAKNVTIRPTLPLSASHPARDAKQFVQHRQQHRLQTEGGGERGEITSGFSGSREATMRYSYRKQ